MKTLRVKVPEELDVKLGVVAAQRNESKSALIRTAIESLVGADGTPMSNSNSCLDLARDLSGCLEGAEDLSYNKKYLRGYGQ